MPPPPSEGGRGSALIQSVFQWGGGHSVGVVLGGGTRGGEGTSAHCYTGSAT